jgi:hypothetical protein
MSISKKPKDFESHKEWQLYLISTIKRLAEDFQTIYCRIIRNNFSFA